MHRRPRRIAAVGAGITCLFAMTVAVAPIADAHPALSTVITGLNAPRGITFDGRGNMYVAESGTVGQGAQGLTRTGAVSKYRWGSTAPVWRTRFESLYLTENPKLPPDVLGPEGLSTLDRSCWYRRHAGCRVSLITSESHDGIAAATKGAIQTTQAGHLFTLNRASGRAHDRADVGDQDYQFTSDHVSLFPSDFPDANPFGVLVTARGYGRARTFVADAGANTIDEIMPGGRVRIVAYIPNETRAPFRDATPTCIAQGRDGYLYVGTLHLVAGAGRAQVWRVNPDANFPTRPRLWARGLTSITGCTFDRHGDLWATEMFADAGPSAPPGDVVRIDGHDPRHRTHYGLGHLPLPGGIAQGPDGAMYVTVNSASPTPGSGAVVRLRTWQH